jgi:hypothetical protein
MFDMAIDRVGVRRRPSQFLTALTTLMPVFGQKLARRMRVPARARAAWRLRQPKSRLKYQHPEPGDAHRAYGMLVRLSYAF